MDSARRICAAAVALLGLSVSACASSTGLTSSASLSITDPVPITAPVPTASAGATPSAAAPPVHNSAPAPPASRDVHAAGQLPVSLPTDSAQQVITVVAPSTSSTTATLRAWQRRGDGWTQVGPSVPSFLGTAGSSQHPNEQTSATPLGSFTLTRAFGHDTDPGTALPYTRTTPADWWISQAGSLYNTFQQCSSNCSFTRGEPNEHLYYETPAYDYAVVIDDNTANSPSGVRQNAGSAFFLHVSEGRPTAGCVSVPAADLLRIMRWLQPAAHPRILIGA